MSISIFISIAKTLTPTMAPSSSLAAAPIATRRVSVSVTASLDGSTVTAALDFPFVSYARLAANKSRTLTPPRHKAKVSNRERAGQIQIQRQDSQRGRVEGQIWSGKVWKLWDCPMTPRQTMPTIDRRLGVYVSVYISVSVSLSFSFSFYFSLCFRCCCCCCCCGVSVNIDVCPSTPREAESFSLLCAVFSCRT